MAKFLGRYEVIRELGRGAFGDVFLAAGEPPGRTGRRQLVAIKRIKERSDTEALESLLHEFALLDQVKHRSLCKVYEYLEEEQAVVMEAVQGLTLRDVMDALDAAKTSMYTEAAVEIGLELADCLYQCWVTPDQFGEPLRLVHRDLKPENVMLTPTGEVKLLDFGLAWVGRSRRRDEKITGTPLYMAPEQALSGEVDHRTDLFALGLILYELLMGEAAYRIPDDGEDPVGQVMERIEQAELKRQIRDLRRAVPSVGPAIQRCLQRRSRARYDTGHELMLDLRRALDKDRGAYLQEFCDYFFSEIHPLPDPPAVDDATGRARNRPSDGVSNEQRRDSMAKDGKPPRPGGPPRPGARGGPPRPGGPRGPKPGGPPGPGPRSAGGPPRPGPSKGGPARPAAGGPPRPGSAAKGGPPRPGSSGRGGPPRPPVGAKGPPRGGPPRGGPPRGGPPSARPPSGPPKRGGPSLKSGPPAASGPPPGASRPPPPPELDAKTADDPSLLSMVPVDDGPDDSVDSLNKPAGSATQFFAIPKAKKTPPPAPMGAGPASIPGAAPPGISGPAGAPPGISAPGAPPPSISGPGAAPPGLSPPGGAPPGGMPMGGGAPMAISGPTAGGMAISGPTTGGAAPGTPFGVGGQPGAAVPAAESRSQNYRVYAIVFFLLFAFCIATVVTVWALVFAGDGDDEPQVAQAAPVAAPAPPPLPTPPPAQDTAQPRPKPKPKPRRRSTSSSTPAAAPAAKPRPKRGPGPISVTLTEGNSTSIEVKCASSGFRQRASFSGGKATVANVPNEDCELHFKGGAPAMYRPVRGNQTLTCRIQGTTGVCN